MIKYIKPLLQYEQQILAILLLLLHSLIWLVSDLSLYFALLPVLYGLFLLWQPVWKKSQQLRFVSVSLPLVLLFLINFFYHKEALFFFCLVIIGFIGSRLFTPSSARSFDLLALSILTIEMAIGVIPLNFEQVLLPLEFESYIQTIMLIAILVVFFAPIPDRSQKAQSQTQIGLMHGILTASLIFIALLGGIVINILYGVDYVEGLLLTVFISATLTLGISWLWNPGVGHSGLGVLWSRYAMTIGGPFETWINTLTTLIEQPYISSSDFLQSACDNLVENDWLNAIQWQFDTLVISSGKKEGVALSHSLAQKLQVTLYFKSNPGQALQQHTILLIRMAYQFYLSKYNQEKMRAEEHFETIHHTGARLTHDIKNILQSIKTSINIVQAKPNTEPSTPYKLLQQNLGQISTRLESTLEKLKAPELNTSVNLQNIRHWFENFKSVNTLDKVRYQDDIEYEHPIPVDLFDSVINNLLVNATHKDETSEIVVDLISTPQLIIITVCDDGKKISSELENLLFNKPVSSGQGMGIGLYQSAFMARTFKYELELATNSQGKVCFSLFQHIAE